MASITVSPRRATRTPARSRVQSTIELATEPPNKRRRYTPSATGHSQINGDDEDTIVASSSRRRSRAVTAPRARSRRLSTAIAEEDDDDATTPTAARSALHSRPRRDRRERPERYVPPATVPRPRYSNSSSAAAASQASDGYKPREERSWEDFHPELDIDAGLMVFTADEVDGRLPKADMKGALAQLGAEEIGRAHV